MYKLATIRVVIAVAVGAVLGIRVSVQAAGAKPVDPDSVAVPKLKSPTSKRLPKEPCRRGAVPPDPGDEQVPGQTPPRGT